MAFTLRMFNRVRISIRELQKTPDPACEATLRSKGGVIPKGFVGKMLVGSAISTSAVRYAD